MFGIVAAVSVYSTDWSASQVQKIDKRIDDGNLKSGHFRSRSGGYIYILEE